ncbi:hypothetical protein [Actinoplanes auranticolor]|uniref:Uncharacterized protein n=1 Tax=Actinoplanes auranticolor TaxID=47988 RepID=A0A919S422_9ACTN|nr:hypothetical protein [Actinoplanes auranticolor]GIM64005.1 hypothetical protein Aau02nite_07760 [Actinoplanes auranticolor]
MPDWLVTLGGWTSLVFGGLGLWRGAILVLRTGPEARDATGMPGQLVLVESSGLILVGAAALLSGGWVHLIWPAVLLLTIGQVRRVSSWLDRRRRRPPLPARGDELAGG